MVNRQTVRRHLVYSGSVKRAFSLLVLSVLSSVAAPAADITGVWTSKTPVQTLTFKQEGAKLTGTVKSTLGTLRIAEGKIEGDEIKLTFFVVLSNGKDPLGLAGYDAMAEEGQVTEITYKGRISGDDIKVSVSQEKLGDVRDMTFHKTN